MILGKISEPVHEDFSVTDMNENLVPGIDSTAFTYHIFDDSGNEVSSTSPVTITELGYGHYRSTFIPNSVGTWMVSVYHSTYFPWGKTGSIQVFGHDFDSIAELVIRILGLTQENFSIDDTVYDTLGNLTNGRIKIYNSASNVGTGSGVIATYSIEATYDSNTGLMVNYEVKKI